MELPFHDESKADEDAKKSDLIAKSSIHFIGHDETDMDVLEAEVRKIEDDSILWGADKLSELCYQDIYIKEFRIDCFVEDDEDWHFVKEQINDLLLRKFPLVELCGFSAIWLLENF